MADGSNAHRRVRALRFDPANSRMNVEYNGDPSFYFDASGVTVPSGETLDVAGTLNVSGSQVVPDDVNLGLGTGSPAKVIWETADANANELLIELPAGGAVDVPVIVIGDTLANDDLGLYNGAVSPVVAIHGSTATATGPSLTFRKSRGTNSAPTVVTSGDDAGSIDFYGAVATDEYVRSVRILAETTGTIATTRGPGVLTLQTATDAAPSVLTTGLTISAAQIVGIPVGATIAGTVTDSATTTKTGTLDASGATVTLPTRSAFIDLEERLKGADGADLALSETADDFFRNIGTNQWNINGEASVNETETSSGWFSFVLPENYVSGGTITLVASALVTLAGDAANDATSTIDMEARLVTKTTGAVGSDLVTTAATTLATAGADYSFTVTPTNLVAGDKLVCNLITNMVETAGGTGAANSVITRLGATIQVNK